MKSRFSRPSTIPHDNRGLSRGPRVSDRRTETLLPQRPAAQRPASSSAPWEEFAYEVARSRRYEHPVTLVVLPLPSDAAPIRVRSVDTVWLLGDSLCLLLPETARTGAFGLLTRLVRESAGLVSTSSARVVSFPEDGPTPLGLIARLRDSLPPSELDFQLRGPSTNGAKPARQAPTGVDGVNLRHGVRRVLDRALLGRARVFHHSDRKPAID